jgi:chromosome segregation ATPase
LSEKDGQLEELQNELKALKNQIPKEEFGTPGGVKLQRVNRKLDDIMKEKIKAEYERDEMSEHISELETQLSELQQKNRDLMADNAELSNLRDTVEELKYLEGKVKNYESVISQYKKKLESMQELKRTFKSLEDKNMLYVQQIVDLESELHKFSTAKEQLDTQKKKINTLENELSKESLKSFELSQELEEKSASVQLLNVEIKDLRKQLELPVLPTVATTPLSSGTDMFKLGMEQTDSESLMEAFTPELKDKMYRLEKENELMKRKITSMENTSDKSQPADSHEAAQLDELRKELAEKSVQVEHLQQSLARRNRDLDQLSDARTTFDQLRAQMKAKDAEIEKLKKYLNKAKKVR